MSHDNLLMRIVCFYFFRSSSHCEISDRIVRLASRIVRFQPSRSSALDKKSSAFAQDRLFWPKDRLLWHRRIVRFQPYSSGKPRQAQNSPWSIDTWFGLWDLICLDNLFKWIYKDINAYFIRIKQAIKTAKGSVQFHQNLLGSLGFKSPKSRFAIDLGSTSWCILNWAEFQEILRHSLLSQKCQFWVKITKMITRVNSRIFTNSTVVSHIWKKYRYRKSYYIGWIHKNLGIRPCDRFCFSVKIWKFRLTKKNLEISRNLA